MLLKITTKSEDVFYVEDKDFADYSYKSNITSSNEFELGGAIPSSLDFSIFDHDFKQYYLYGAKVEAFIGDIEDTSKRLGTFKINDININQDLIVLQSDDALSDTDVRWKGRSFPCTMWEVLVNVCLQCDINLNTTQEELVNSSIVLTTEGELRGVKCREILKWIAEANGMFCLMNKDNQLIFKKYDFDNIKNIQRSDTTDLILEQTNTIRKGIRVNGNVYGDTQYPIKVEDNRIFNSMTSANLTLACNNLIQNIRDIEYFAGTYSIWNRSSLYNYHLSVGDVIVLQDDDGDYFYSVIHDLTMDNEDEYFEISSYGDSIKDKNENKDEDNPDEDPESSSGGSGSGDNSWGVVKNHQAIDAKQGRFIILEKTVYDVDYFTKINLELSINFIYTSNKFINFEIYSNDKLIRKVPVMGTGQLYHVSESFLADIDYKPNFCTYTVVVNINDGEELIIAPFEAILTLKALYGRIEDQTATDQLFIERIKLIDTKIANQKRVSLPYIRDEVTVPEPMEFLFDWDITRRRNGSVKCEYYEDSHGNGEIKLVTDSSVRDRDCWAPLYVLNDYSVSNCKRVTDNTVKITYCDTMTGTFSISFPNYCWTDMGSSTPDTNMMFKKLKTIDITENPHFGFSLGCFMGLSSIEEVIGDVGGVGQWAFKDCTSLVDIDLSNLTIVHDGAFENCTSLEYVDLSSLVGTASYSGLGAESFKGCTSLEYAKLPSNFPSLTVNNGYQMCNGAFYGCSLLNSVVAIGHFDMDYSNYIAADAFHGTVIDTFFIKSDVDGLMSSRIVDMINNTYGDPTVYIKNGTLTQQLEQLILDLQAIGCTISRYNIENEQTILNSLINRSI